MKRADRKSRRQFIEQALLYQIALELRMVRRNRGAEMSPAFVRQLSGGTAEQYATDDNNRYGENKFKAGTHCP